METHPSSTSRKKKEPSALIMKGGGIKGLAYVGALEELTKHYDFYWFAGTSAGAVSAILLGSGFEIEELKTILMNKEFSDFKDAGFFKKIYNLLTKQGLYEAETFNTWLTNELSTKLKSAVAVKLEDLPKRVTVYASRREKRALVYDSNDTDTKSTRAVYAARCSMSIPLFFTPQKQEGLNVFDGGAQNNYPVKILLEHNPGTKFIGLYLGSEHYEHPKKTSLIKEMLSIWTEAMDYEALTEFKDETIIIDTRPISTLKFNLKKNEKEFLLEIGRLAALKFLVRKNKITNRGLNLVQKEKELQKQKAILVKEAQRNKNVNRAKKITIAALVILAFVLINKFYLPSKEKVIVGESFSTTVLVHGKNGKDDRILKNQGKVVIDFGNTREEEPINEKGEATFKEIPAKFMGENVLLSVTHPQPYLPIKRDSSYILERNKSIYLEVELKGLDKIFGRVIDYHTEQPLENVVVSVRDTKTVTNEIGWFELKIPSVSQDKFVKVSFIKSGYMFITQDSIAPHTKKEIGVSLKRIN
ncbi:patatin-like phospholipase family protein [Zobellia uliginosa]|uniref:patatin-like phospholipase family protein n=1 Tax=Zobellia uliginosa TaxID=143224 RepID=UPI001C071B88|nr:patatin-like phospholipase family protein [Zobellia uliginosa]MBU2946600.1 patatin-like phospholipase family protein [Zobellia uliginosa]